MTATTANDIVCRTRPAGLKLAALAAALLIVACSSGSEPIKPQSAGGEGGLAGDGGQSGSGAGQGGSTGSAGGQGGSGGTGGGKAGTGGGGSGVGGTAGAQTPDAAAASPDLGVADQAMPMGGGKALLIVGTIPLVGTDTQFKAALEARGLEVEVAQEKLTTPANAEGKRVIIMSYSMKSTTFKAEAFTDVPVPVIVTEHFLLSRLKMASSHGYTPSNLTKLTIISDHELAGEFPKGDVVVYDRMQEMFWGAPPATAINIAHITGQPAKMTYFAYEKGAMMDGAVAPAKRVQFFHATHSPDPVDRNLYLSANGLKLLGATLDWCLK